MDLQGLIIAIGILALLILAVKILIIVLIIRAIIEYAARKFAEENTKQQQKIFEQQANYFAARLAEEMRKASDDKPSNEN